MSEILLYHGSKEEVVYPEIRITRYTKDFSWGFYCTNNYQQAYRWADRRSADGLVNVYRYAENPDLKILRFPQMSDPWQTTPFVITSTDLRPGRSVVKHFGPWRNSSIQHIKSAFIP